MICCECRKAPNPNLVLHWASPEFIQNSLSDASEGRVVSSVMKIENAGHLVSPLFDLTNLFLTTALGGAGES